MADLPKITHVAIKHAGKVHSLPAPNRHHHVIRAMGGIPGPDIQGFLDDTGRFLDRREAYELASKNGQMIRPDDPTKYQGDQLFSEDLW